MYDEICRKLGFEPKDLKHELKDNISDDSYNPFAILTKEELQFLIDNNMFA